MSEKVEKSKKDKSKSKSKGSEVTSPTVEWDSNSSSNHCVLCKAQWGTFRNRRHHCRNCGRLVCESCSTQRFKLGGEDSTELPQRVCDVCFDILRQKREMKIQVVQLKDKNLELMLQTSLISDSLINLFYLDGSTKTVGIDDTTTIADLAHLGCPIMKVALFEVVQNIYTPSQYKLLLPKQNVASLIDGWQKGGQPYIKVVVPLTNPTSTAVSVDFGESTNRSSMIGTGYVATTPSPAAKSIYKVKQSPVVTSPIYLTAPTELMGTSYDSNRSEVRRSPPNSPPRKQPSQSSGLNESASRTSSFSDTPTETASRGGGGGGGGGGGQTRMAASNSNAAAELVANQVQIASLQAEIAALKADLKKAQQKYDVLHAVCFKSGQLDVSRLQLQDNPTGQSPVPVAQPRYGSGDSSNLAGWSGSSIGTGVAVPPEKKISKRSSFSWSTSQKVSSTSATAAANANNAAAASERRGSGLQHHDDDGADGADREPVLYDRSTFSFARKPVAVRSSIVGSSSTQNFADVGREGPDRARTNTAGTMDTSELIHIDRPNSRNAGSPHSSRGVNDDVISETDISSVTHFNTIGNGTVTDKLQQESRSAQIMNDVLQDPSKILTLNSSALHLMVRTFFCKVGEIEGFCNLYCRLFDSVLHTNVISHNDSALTTTAALARAAAAGPGSPGDDNNGGGTDPKLIIHVYHMIAAMDGVYEFLTEYHEDWRSGLRTWLLRTFEECVQLPVVRVDDLKCSTYCLQRENMILSPEVLEIIQGSIDASMHGRSTLQQSGGSQRFKFSSGGDGAAAAGGSVVTDIVGRTQEGQYNTSSYDGSVYVQTMENITSTYYSVIGDLLPTLPVEIDVFALFQLKLVAIVKHYIRAVYFAHKQTIAPGELIRLVAFYDKLATFSEKFSKTTSPQLIKIITEMRPEVLRQCNTALVANLSEQMLKLYNMDEPAMSAEVDISAEKRGMLGPDASDTASEVGGGGGGLTRSGSSTSLVNMTKTASMSDLLAANAAGGTSPAAPTSGVTRLTTQWPVRLVGLLRQHLGWIPSEVDPQKKVYWCVLMLDTLQEFQVKLSNWLTQSIKANIISTGQLVKYVNNHTKFAVLLNDYCEEWAAELSDRHAAALFEKAQVTSSLFMENCSAGVENIAQLLYTEMKDILKANLFRSGWDDSVKCVIVLKSALNKQFSFLQMHLSAGLSACDSGGLEAVQQLLIYICECIVSIYIELLLTNTNISMTLTTISRLSEDLELITKLFEELRIKIYLARLSQGRAPHIIETITPKVARKNKMLSFGLKPHLSGRKRTNDPPLEPGKVPARPAAAPAPQDEDEHGRSSNSIANLEEDSKATFKAILQPLTHVVLAIQMNNQYLPDFVKSELYADFGAASLQIWQLIMYWRKESKEDIQAAYDKLFQNWRRPALDEPQIDVSAYIGKVKAANVVR